MLSLKCDDPRKKTKNKKYDKTHKNLHAKANNTISQTKSFLDMSFYKGHTYYLFKKTTSSTT